MIPIEIMMPTTWWTMIMAAGLDTAAGRACLETLIRRYRPPSVKFLRLLGADEDVAEDLAQDYFISLMTGAPLRENTIRVSFGRFVMQGLRNTWRSRLSDQKAQKRGGGAVHVPVEDEMLGDRPDLERAFHSLYVLHHVDLAKIEIEAMYRAKDNGLRWDVLSPFLLQTGDYKVAANQLGVSVPQTRTWFARLRDAIVAKVHEFADQSSLPEHAAAERAHWEQTARLASETEPDDGDQ